MNSVVWVIDRTNFKNILMKVSEEKIGEYVKYLNRVAEISLGTFFSYIRT